jgi:hypothetical protein
MFTARYVLPSQCIYVFCVDLGETSLSVTVPFTAGKPKNLQHFNVNLLNKFVEFWKSPRNYSKCCTGWCTAGYIKLTALLLTL